MTIRPTYLFECQECGTRYKKPVDECRNCGGSDIDLWTGDETWFDTNEDEDLEPTEDEDDESN